MPEKRCHAERSAASLSETAAESKDLCTFYFAATASRHSPDAAVRGEFPDGLDVPNEVQGAFDYVLRMTIESGRMMENQKPR